MRILVVDDQADLADDLAQKIHAATGHDVTAAAGSEQALEIARQEGAPDVLVSEIVLNGLDGFRLSEGLRAGRSDLFTIYVTAYDVSQYQDYLNGTPVFYKPVDAGEVVAVLPAPAETPRPGGDPAATDQLSPDQRTQSARLRNLVGKQGFTGKLDQFDLVDIIQMCCVGKRTGRLQIARRAERGVLYLRGGQIIHAASGTLEGEEAVYEIIGWSGGQFSFEDGVQPEEASIQTGWEHLVMEGVRRRDESVHAEQAGRPDDGADPTLAGKQIGPYELKRKIGQGERSQVFQAVQTSMNRVVALKILLPEFQHDEAAIQAFLASASAKANVQHPSILAVYEAGESEGIYYYTREFVDGATLGDLHAEGKTIDDGTAIQCIKIAAEALSYLNQQKVAHPALTAADLFLGRDNRPRVNNLATLPDEQTPGTQHDIRALSRVIADCLPNRTAAGAGLRSLLSRMLLDGASGYQSWGALLQGVKALEPKVVPEDAFKLNAQEKAAIEAVNAAKRRQRRALILTTVGMFMLLWIVVAAAYFILIRPPGTKNFNRMLAVPAGEFIYQNGEKKSTGAFWIDEYEVTIGQYEQFLASLRQHPTMDYEAPNVPKGHRHDSDHWLQLYSAASTGSKFYGVAVDVNYPAVFVDWFDAYAYARWKGHRLPTDEEWEKAARGVDGRRFPWGDDATKISRVNTSADYNAQDGAAPARVDGYNRWSPVDAMTGDKSPYGVMDMAGNVSEWTATVTRKGPVDYPWIRGGNFGSADFDALHRFNGLADLESKDRVGFRTVADKPPQ